DPAAPAASDQPMLASTVRSSGTEQRQLTIMACNLVGSVSLSTSCDPEQMHDVVASFHKAVAEVMEQFDGFVAQYLSDGVLVYFGYPLPREHDADQAIRAALFLLDTVGALKAASNVGVQGRAGIATGRVVVSEQSGADDTRRYVATGETPILAMRLQAI